jgi:hypothetical protein
MSFDTFDHVGEYGGAFGPMADAAQALATHVPAQHPSARSIRERHAARVERDAEEQLRLR